VIAVFTAGIASISSSLFNLFFQFHHWLCVLLSVHNPNTSLATEFGSLSWLFMGILVHREEFKSDKNYFSRLTLKTQTKKPTRNAITLASYRLCYKKNIKFQTWDPLIFSNAGGKL